MRRIHAARIAIAVVSAALVGCAGINYKKVPTPTQYKTWSDSDQRRADSMKGVRYYLPRPFLNLKQSVPVAQRVAFVSFEKDAKGYKLIPPKDAPTWVSRVAPPRLSVTQALAATLASAPSAEEKDKGSLQTDSPGGGDEGATLPDESVSSPSTLKATTGFINATDPVTALGDKMDVVYLPDFEEQYVIQPRAGLGSADIETRLRNGWAAEVFTQDVDNSNLIPYVLKQVETASSLAANIATTWGFQPAGGKLDPASVEGLSKEGLADAGALQAGAPGGLRGAEALLGDVLLFKIAEVRIAQPGLYPILKPREIRQWLVGESVISVDPELSFELFLQKANVPWIRPDMAFIPCPPFTMVGFNTTTDVFLAPATERMTLTSSLDGGNPHESNGAQHEEPSGPAADVTVALEAALPTAGDSALRASSVQTVRPADFNPNETVIRLTAAEGEPFSREDTAKYADWVAEALGYGEPAGVGNVEVRLEGEGAGVTVTVSKELDALARQVRASD